MASLFISTALALSLLTLSYAQVNPGSYDISAEQGWDNFVKEAAKGTGGTPINMNEFVTRVNNNVNDGDQGEESDPELMKELKAFNEKKNFTSVNESDSNNSKPIESDPNYSEPTAAMDDLAMAKMIASANGGSLAPENAPLNGAFSIKVVGVIVGLLPVFAAYFVL